MTAQKLAVGLKVKFVPFVEEVRNKTVEERKAARKTASGTVVYINTPHKYFTIEYDWYGNRMRESFKFVDFGQVVVPSG